MSPRARAMPAVGEHGPTDRARRTSTHDGSVPYDVEGYPTGEYPRLDSPGREIPIHTAAFVRSLVADHASRLLARSAAFCRLLGIEDFTHEAVRLTVLRLLSRGAPITDRGPHSAVRYALVVVRRLCVDELRRRALEECAATLAPAGVIDADDSLDRLRADMLVDVGPTADPGRLLRAALCCFEYLAAHVDPGQPTAAQCLRAYWLRCVEGADSHEIACCLGLPQPAESIPERGKRLVLGWLHALCSAGPRAPEGDGARSSFWQVGFEAGQSFLLEHPDWWTKVGGRPGAGRGGR